MALGISLGVQHLAIGIARGYKTRAVAPVLFEELKETPAGLTNR